MKECVIFKDIFSEFSRSCNFQEKNPELSRRCGNPVKDYYYYYYYNNNFYRYYYYWLTVRNKSGAVGIKQLESQYIDGVGQTE